MNFGVKSFCRHMTFGKIVLRALLFSISELSESVVLSTFNLFHCSYPKQCLIHLIRSTLVVFVRFLETFEKSRI